MVVIGADHAMRDAIIGAVTRTRPVTVTLPSEAAERDGLAYTLWLPSRERANGAGVLILHGAGSRKENHHDFARAAVEAGFAALAFDQRGHGDSRGQMDGRVLGDIAAMAGLLRSRIGSALEHGRPTPRAPVALRGSSMGGYLAIVAGAAVGAAAVVAICPAGSEGLRRGLAAGKFELDADVPALDAFFAEHELDSAVRSLDAPLLLLHAEGDERVPVQQSIELERSFHVPGSRLITVAGGHHRSIQHDGELQAVSLRFIADALGR